jgi:hypothetical protein
MKIVEGWKGFDSDFSCRGFKFEVGKEYGEKEAKICNSGFHFCTDPIDVFSYYFLDDDGNFKRFAKVEGWGKIDKEESEDSKVCSTNIKINRELSFKNFLKLSIEYENKKCKENATNASSGNNATNASSGNNGSIEIKGKNSVGVCAGSQTIVKGIKGTWFGLTSYDKDGNPNGGKFFKIDGKKYKENTFYKIVNMKIIKV